MKIPITRTVLAAGLLTGGLATSAQAADAASPSVSITHRTLTITGTAASDKLALRLRAGHPGTLQVDVGDDSTADFQVRRHRPVINLPWLRNVLCQTSRCATQQSRHTGNYAD